MREPPHEVAGHAGTHRVKPGRFIVVDAHRHERVASSLYSGRMLKSFRLGGAVRISPFHCHAPDDIARFLATTGTLAANR
ncbi:hypothetical protein [Burkholderia ambifaria]|jgi:hypothetical protein|uniref:Uncharacterized protein n=1 Tax=Burkholderia ambifaria IOP40-10 TaxID=396596 RepID=B1FRW3_9BURK|nr:hypothetical protein [Burkholderia ambifaria]EDS99707.1 hypothetical protein BamIOP4010DRAFT_6776 [Burkholderia ambifaria IOP40-10]